MNEKKWDLSNDAKNLLWQIAYDKKNDDFNVFSVLRNANHEIRHSSFLAWLFDKDEDHGFGKKFAVSFFSCATKGLCDYKYFCNEVNKDREFWSTKLDESYYVYTEYPVPYFDKEKTKTTNKRIDILIVGETFTCTIENKYGSPVHDDQLQRYKEFVETRKFIDKKDHFFIFLDIPEDVHDFEVKVEAEYEKEKEKKNNAIDPSNEYDGYTYISYKNILDILTQCLDERRGGYEKQDEFIRKYIQSVNTHVRYEDTPDEICNRILNSQSLEELYTFYNKKYTKDSVEMHCWENLNPKYQDSLNAIMERVNSVQRNNDKRVEKVLKEHLVSENIINKDAEKKNEKRVVGYHSGRKSSSEPYAWRLLTDNEINYIRQVDYTTKFGRYDIRFYFGLDSPTSNNLISKINENREIISKLKNLITESEEYKWVVALKYCVCDESAYHLLQEFDDYAPSVLGENAIIGLQKILETKYSTHIGKIRKNVILDNNELAADIKELLTGIYGEETTEFIQSAINRYLTENETTPEEYDEKLKEYNKKKELNKSIEERYLVEKGDNEKQKIYKKQYKKFDPRYTERLVKPNPYPAVVIRWELDISCVLNEKPLITEKDFNAVFKSESNLADIYRKQTNKIFDIFGSTLSVIQK